MTPWDLLIAVAVLAITGGLGYLGHRHPGGRHVQPSRFPFPGAGRAAMRLLRSRRRRDEVDHARTLAWLSRVELHHEVSPAAAAQVQAHVCGLLASRVHALAAATPHPPAWAAIPAASGPVPPALEDGDDPRYEHLRSGQYGGWTTGQFEAVALGGGNDR